uniref:Uncharacterized protein n=1 Tax=Gouania willdenowi TaxID=441366 RepID=A0A8C5NHP4_GOUWI
MCVFFDKINFPSPLTNLGRVPPPGHVLGSDSFLDAVHLLLVALAVAYGVLLGFLQSRFQGLDPASTSALAFSLSNCSSTGTLSPRFSSFSNQVTVLLRVLFFSFSRSYFCFHCSAVNSTFTVTVFLIVFALDSNLCPNMRVDLVSASL